MVCLNCGSANLVNWGRARDVEYCTSLDFFNYNKCIECNTLSIDPIPENRLDEIYPHNYYSFTANKKSFVLFFDTSPNHTDG